MVLDVGVDVVRGCFFGRADSASEEPHYSVIGFPSQEVVGVGASEEAEGDLGLWDLLHV